MKTKNLLHFLLIVLVSICFSSCSFSQDKTKAQKTTTILSAENVHYKVTFIELGSVRCIPCQKMQPVMKNIEEKYGKEVKVVFHDVWTHEGCPYIVKNYFYFFSILFLYIFHNRLHFLAGDATN